MLEFIIENLGDIIYLTLSIIGGATVLFRIIAPWTETKKDDKILKALETILERVSLNKDRSKVEVKIN